MSATRSPPKPPSLTYDIDLPDYSIKQEISIDLLADEEKIYNWYIDGELHSTGLGNTSFRARPPIGEHEISFIATYPDGEVFSSWSDTILITE